MTAERQIRRPVLGEFRVVRYSDQGPNGYHWVEECTVGDTGRLGWVRVTPCYPKLTYDEARIEMRRLMDLRGRPPTGLTVVLCEAWP